MGPKNFLILHGTRLTSELYMDWMDSYCGFGNEVFCLLTSSSSKVHTMKVGSSLKHDSIGVISKEIH
jgi:hypothetical protein